MKVHKSPYNKMIMKKGKILLFVGNTGEIYQIPLILAITIKLNFFIFVKKEKVIELVRKGIINAESYKKILLEAKSKSIKDNQKQIPYIVIAPTMNCNLKCPYCFVKNQLKNQVIKKEIIDKIIEYIGFQGGYFSIDWFGGEPSLAPDMIQYFYDEADKREFKNVKSLLITNCVHINEKMWYVIENYITKIQITIDGFKNYHDKRRKLVNGEGSFDKIISNLDILYERILNKKVKKLIKVVVRCNVDKDNIFNLSEFRQYILLRYNFLFSVEFARVQECGIAEYDNRILSEKQYCDFLVNLYETHGVVLEPYLSDFNVRFNHCGAVNPKSLVFDPSGNVYKCSLDCGNEKKRIGSCFSKIRNDNSIETKYSLSNLDLLPKKCNKCSLLFFCWGGCPQQRINKNMKKVCCYHKKGVKKFISIMYELAMFRKRYPLIQIF